MLLLDIISNEGGFMGKINETLIELILRNPIKLKNDKPSGNTINKRRAHKAALRHKSSIAAIVANIAINSLKAASQEDESQVNDTLERTAAEEPENKKENAAHGGYGTIKPYAGMSAYHGYVNYDKLWSHLGQFIAYGAYGRIENENMAMENGESTRQMISKETMEKAAKHFKYFVMGDIMGDIGFVPPAGLNIDSGEWEKYRLMSMMSVYRPLLALKRATA